jgi:hypothetical protein
MIPQNDSRAIGTGITERCSRMRYEGVGSFEMPCGAWQGITVGIPLKDPFLSLLHGNQ